MRSGTTTILVRRFDDLSPDADLGYFAQGFQGDLVIELARFVAFEVFAPAAAEPDPAIDAAHELVGSIRRAHEGLRIQARLVERGSGRMMWAERFDVAQRDPFDVQSEIAGAVAGALAVNLDLRRLERARREPPTTLAAYDLWLRGRAALEQGTPEADLEARSLFEAALALDPRFSRAYAGISLSYHNDWSCQSWHLWHESEAQAQRFAKLAASLDDGDELVHVVLARVRLYRREFERAEQSLARAMALNPNDADVTAHAALWTIYLGDAPRSLELARRAMELNARHGDWYHVPALWAHFLLGDGAAALREGARAGRVFVDVPAVTAAAAALHGEDGEARRALEVFRQDFRGKVLFRREPDPGEELDWLLQVNPFRRATDRERFRLGLLRAGLVAGAREREVELRPADLTVCGNVFRRDDDLWTIAFDGKGARLVGVKGFHDLARLLREPHRPVHCLELSRAPDAPGAADVFDSAAKRAIERRLAELTEESDEAVELGDAARAERARAELDRLTSELARALGLGGRSRKLGDATERARSATTWRIRSAIKRVAAAHPRLGQHLENSVRTGVVCCYRPEAPLVWEV